MGTLPAPDTFENEPGGIAVPRALAEPQETESNMSNATTLATLFALTGTAAPRKGTKALELLAACPADRLVRAVAWYVVETTRGDLSAQRLCGGIGYIAEGYGDVREVAIITRGAPKPSATPSVAETIEVRGATSGKWGKSLEVRRTHGTRARIELATAWLASAGPCLAHADCAAVTDLGAACAAA